MKKLETGNWKLRGIKSEKRNSEIGTHRASKAPAFRIAHSESRPNGFTLIELMLAMAFLSFMLIFIVLALIQYMATYNKGIIYKEINQSGRTIFEDVTRAMRVASVNIRSVGEGRLCVGGQSYVWNTDTTNNRYQKSGAEITGIVRVPDSSGSICSADSSVLPDVDPDIVTVIASPDIAVQSFDAKEADEGGLYYLSFKLSTAGQNAPVNFEGDIQCPPGREGQYCALAEFTTHVASRR